MKQIQEEVLKESLELCATLGTLSQGFTAKRRADIKQVLNYEFKGICNDKAEASEWLFGDNLGEKLKTSKATANIVRSTVRSQYRPQRFNPYGTSGTRNLNWKGPSLRRGGWFNNRASRGGQRSNPYRPYQYQSQYARRNQLPNSLPPAQTQTSGLPPN